jgi:hypothetical protein
MLHKFSKLIPYLLCASLLMVSGIASADGLAQNPAITLSQSPKKLIPAQVVHAVRQDLAQRTKIAAGTFKVKESSPQTWHDGCLGLAAPNEFCTMALVEGWQVVMVKGNKTWTYRTDNSGRAVRLEKF